MMFRNMFIIVIFWLLVDSSSQYPVISSQKDCFLQNSEDIRIFLTISSVYTSTTAQGIVQRQLEVNWVGHPSAADSISIYLEDPVLHPKSKPIFSFDPMDHPGGYLKSDILIPIHFFDVGTLSKGPCVGYWAAYHDTEGKVMSSNCLHIRPSWMEAISEHLQNLRLHEIMIPGSHDSGSFYFHREIDPLAKYKYAQEESIFNQLVYGLRYFDLRVGYYPKTEDKFYINHNFLKTEHSVKSVLHQVMKFVKSTSKEIVILDFHNFPIGFSNDLIHVKLLHLIKKSLGSYLIPHNEQFKNATLSQIWKHGKRVLVSYDSNVSELVYPKSMWPSIPRAWGNKQYPQDLKTYFEEVFERRTPDGIWASMAELTPNTKTIILHPESGLRIFADKINKNVTHWFRDMYWQKANIIATDYFLGNDIIDVSIRTNKIKGICPESSWPYLRP